MHCHTREGSLDGKVEVADYIRVLKEKGFDGMLVSDHNSYNGYRKWKKSLRGRKFTDFVVLKGIEYDTIDAGHILVIMPETLKLRILELRGLPVGILIDIVHRYGGVLGPAHPCGERYLSFINTRKRRNKEAVMEKFDFVETFNSCESEQSNAEAAGLADKFHKPGFGGSDSHKVECIGTAYTEFPVKIEKESDLIRCIRYGEGITCGGVYYKGTTKQKLGIFNHLLVQSFWVYNRVSGWLRLPKRKKELKKKDLKIKIPFPVIQNKD